jgi:acyl-coenzyme A thioesterase PaaI-like protein
VRPADRSAAYPADHLCFGCSPRNPAGLQLEFEPEADGVRSSFRLGRQYESYPGVVHGGIVSAICDEVMGNLIVLRLGTPAFTVSARQRFITPLRVGDQYACVARFGRPGDDQRLYHVMAEVLDAGGAVCATATASYRPFALADLPAPGLPATDIPDADTGRSRP